MAELDRFDSQLTAAVQGFADRAKTEVDAVAVATHAARGRRRDSMTWLGRSVSVPVAVLLVLALLATLTVSAAVGGWWPFRSSVVPAGPTPNPGVTVDNSPTPSPDPKGRAHVTGSESVVMSTSASSRTVGAVTELRGGVVSVFTEANDPRASGTGTFSFSVDVTGNVGVEWGIYHLDVVGGAWDGPCSGATWDAGDAAVGTCWLTGSGTLAGFTYNRTYSWVPGQVWVEGIIYPGPLPPP